MAPEDHVRFDDQVRLEQEMLGLGIHRYQSAVTTAKQRKQESTTSYGQTLIRAAVDPLAEAISEFIDETNSGKAGARATSVTYLEYIDTMVAAFITVRTELDSITFAHKFTNAAVRVGQGLQDEVRFRAFHREAPGFFRVVRRDLQKRGSNLDSRRKVLIHTMNNKADVGPFFPRDEPGNIPTIMTSGRGREKWDTNTPTFLRQWAIRRL